MKIIRHEDPAPDEHHVTFSYRGGALDGHEWRQVKAHTDDGAMTWLWMSNVHEGYFKRVFVPWDFEHPSIVL